MEKSRVLTNMGWIVGCKIAQSLIQLVIGMLSARYLGPSNYGLISYAASLTAFASPVMQLGFRSTLVQAYVDAPEKSGEIMGTCLVLNLISAGACVLGVTCFALAAQGNSSETVLVCFLYSLSLVFQAGELVQYWFQAGLLSKYPSLVMLGAHVCVSGYKLYLLATGKPVYWFALSHAVEYGAVGAGLLLAYRKLCGNRLRFSRKTAGEMLPKSKYYIAASLMVTAFQNTDHVMLNLLVGQGENGYYTAAVTCGGVTRFVFAALIDSARPVILAKRKQSPEAYGRALSDLYSVVIWLSLAQSTAFTLLAEPVVLLLYGGEYLPTVPVLRILTWYTAFSYMGTVRNIWILAEEKQELLWKINLSGVLINVGLNALVIPLWGARGAAFASLVTQVFSNFIMGFCMKPLRPHNRLLLRGLNPRRILAAYRRLVNNP